MAKTTIESLEKNESFLAVQEEKDVSVDVQSIAAVEPNSSDVIRQKFRERYPRPLAWFLEKLFDSGAEARGIERVPEIERKKASPWDQVVFWFSVNLSFTSLGSGMLGGMYFNLSFNTSVIVIMVMSFVGVATTAWIATMGPRYGLRTIALARFAGGWPGTFIFALLNVLTQLAYSVVVCLAGAQALHAVNSDISLTVGIVVISMIVMVLSIYGLQLVKLWERYAWIACFIIFLIIAGLGSRGGYDLSKGDTTQATGSALIGNVLTFAGIFFSIGSGWTTIAADYNADLQPDTPPMRTAILTFIGIYVPICFGQIISAAIFTIKDPVYVEALSKNSLGGLIGKILEPTGGFGKFLLVILMLSAVSSNVPNTYSGALSIQTLHPLLMKVSRVLYVFGFTAIYLIVTIVGQQHFSEILSNFASLLAYWTAFFIVIMVLEHVWFRRKNGPLGKINPDDFNDFSRLPPGYACCGSILVAIAGCVPAIDTTWFVGPIALAVTRPYGGDLGFEFSAVFTFVSYLVFRTVEIRHFGR